MVDTPRTLTLLTFMFYYRDSSTSTSFAQPSGLSLSPGNILT
jgi:hypothetical protein